MIKHPLYILCGGHSKRMGTDKALLTLRNETLLERQIRRSSICFDEIALLSGDNHYQTHFRQIKDYMEQAGPLSALLAALYDAKSRYEYLSILPVDVPLLTHSTRIKLAETIPDHSSDAVILRHKERIQPLAGIYRTDIHQCLAEFLEKGGRRVMDFIAEQNIQFLDVTEVEVKNLNYPEDLQNCPG